MIGRSSGRLGKGTTMAQKLSRNDFLIKDLVVSVGGGGRGGTWLPADDGETPPPWISPIAGVFSKLDLLAAVKGAIEEAVEAGALDDVARAFDARDVGGNALIRSAIHDVGAAVVASAAYAGLAGGSVALPDPDCGGTSLETIPPTLTPIVHSGMEIHRLTELPRLKRQLAESMEYVEKLSSSLAPQGRDAEVVRDRLKTAMAALDG